MQENEIFEKIKSILIKDLSLKLQITREMALIRDLGMDSMDFATYIIKVEDIFHMKISNEDIENYQLGILNNMINYLKLRNNNNEV